MDPEPLVPGEVFAERYRILRRLAAGGMGTVYVAEQVATGRRRALKHVHGDLVGDPKVRELFEREVQVGNGIGSDHVVKVLDAGVDDATGAPWLVMELLLGESLHDEVERDGALPLARAADVLMQLGHGLAAAHRADVIHRDLKPANVMICPPDREGEALVVKILDFGLARFVEGPSTRTQPMGTPLWMAPEQVTGGPLDCAVDVFSLGLLAFYVLTGKPFWRIPEHGPANWMYELLYTQIPSASARAAELGVPASRLPDGFDAWFARATARMPEDRFANAGAARDALRAVLGLPDEPPARPAATPAVPAAPPAATWPEPSAPPPQPPGAAYDPAWFVGREAEAVEAARYLRSPGKPAVLWGPHHAGKTWLLRRLASHVRADGYRTAVLQTPLLVVGEPPDVLRAFGEAILEACGADPALLADPWRGFGTPMAKLSRAVEQHVLAASEAPLCLAMDDVDAVFRSPVRDDFFSLLRAWAERTEPAWARLRLLLAVSRAPGALMEDSNRSPFNLTAPVRLQSLRGPDLARLASLHGLLCTAEDIGWLLQLTGGQPMLVRRILYRAATGRTGIEQAASVEVGELSAWLHEQGLIGPARALLAGREAAIDPRERGRLVRAGVAIEAPSGELLFATPCHRDAVDERGEGA